MRCSCGGLFQLRAQEIQDDTRHGELKQTGVYVCSDCGRTLTGEQLLVRTAPTKEERAKA